MRGRIRPWKEPTNLLTCIHWFQFHNTFTSNNQRITNLDAEQANSFSPRMSRVEYCKWRMTVGDYTPKYKMYEVKFILKLVKICVFWLFSHWYGRLGRNIGSVLSTPETSNKVSQAAASNKRSAENNSAEGKTVTSKDVYSEAMIEPGLRFYWNSIENFHSSEKQQSGAVIFCEIKNEKNNFWNKI